MSVLFLILPLTLLFSGLAVVAYVWATRAGQLDDLDTPPLRMLRDGTSARTDAPTDAPTAEPRRR